MVVHGLSLAWSWVGISDGSEGDVGLISRDDDGIYVFGMNSE